MNEKLINLGVEHEVRQVTMRVADNTGKQYYRLIPQATSVTPLPF